MPGARLDRILARLADSDLVASARLCAMCAEATEMSGAGIMLMSGDLPQGSVCTTDAVSLLIEDLQYTLGEGPCVDAYQHDRPVLEPDLAAPITNRWVAFTPPAVEAGVRAVFGFPLSVGAARLGALNLHRDRPGQLTADQHTDALVMAGLAARAVIAMQADAPPGAIGVELADGADFQFVGHQAAGMVSVQLGVSVADALIRLRAHAFQQDRRFADVARDVVGRRLRLTDDADRPT